MSREKSVKFADTGHLAILESIQAEKQLNLVHTFNSNHTICGLATTQTNDKVFIKVKGYRKTKVNEERFKRAVTSNRMAGKIKGSIMPKLLEIKAFRRDNILWITTLNSYGGEPMSHGMFFSGDEAIVNHRVVMRIRHSIEVIQKSPSVSLFYSPQTVSKWIAGAFGRQAIPGASEWTSAHCDLHWGNILDGGNHIIDWDMFSLAPKGFDAASILLFSSSNMRLFKRLHRELFGILDNDSARVATLFAAARILRLMSVDAFADMKIHEPNIREAVRLIVSPDSR